MPHDRPSPARILAVFLGLLVVYAAGLVVPAGRDAQVSPTEAHRLMAAHSIVTDGDLDLLDDYRAEAWRRFGGISGGDPDRALRPTVSVRPTRDGGQVPVAPGGFLEPTGLGIGTALAPAYWVGHHTGIGARLAVQLWCAALLALAFALAIGIARRLVAEPWATRGVVAVGLSPPAVIGATGIGPTGPVALLLVGAVLTALLVRDRPRTAAAIGCALLCALLPWLWLPLAPVALVVAAALARWMRRRRRGLGGFVALEVGLLSAVIYLTVHDRVYGGPTPWAGATGWGIPTDFDGLADALGRVLAGTLGVAIDRDFGLLRWAPVLALVGVAAWRLARWRRTRLHRAFADEIHVEVVAGFVLLVALALVVPYAVLSPWPTTNWLGGPGAAPALLLLAPLVAWGWQRTPRTAAALAGITVVATAWLLVAGLLDPAVGTTPPSGALPWGGLEDALPRLRR
ncbi:MAG: hypothetical protein M0P31_19110 [Solirubrobacteraceae bacterium]|nr:hypothetical protein [Solirubrobacteraceae bacterium]